MNVNRIALVGISASGKSTLARTLAHKTNLPVTHMDQLFWRGYWEAVPAKEYLVGHEKAVQKDKWIIEGYVDITMKSRLEKADLIIYLDYSGIRCAWQLIKRWVKHRRVSRPELPKEALEEYELHFLWLALTRGERPEIEKALVGIQSDVVRIKSPNELQIYIQNNF